MTTAGTHGCDEIVADLQRLREEAGSPSYGDLVLGISRLRVERGMTPAQARVGRTTVYDAFRPGRRFLDPDLVGELVVVLGAPEDEQAWVRRCRLARTVGTVARGAGLADTDEVATGPGVESPDVELTLGKTRRPALPSSLVVAVLLGCLAVNLLGRLAVDFLPIPLYLDMIGTAIVAIVVGPWRAAAVGVATSLIGASIDVWAWHVHHVSPTPHWWLSWPFGLVEIVGALIWGYGVRRWRMGRTIPRFFALNVLVAVACSLVAVPIIVGISGGFTVNSADLITRGFMQSLHNIWSATFSQNLVTSTADKMIAGFVALAAAEAIPSSLAEGRERLKITSAWLMSIAWVRRAVRA